MLVRDIMTADPGCCTLETSIPDVARLMVKYDCGEIPITDPETSRLAGVITDRDIVCRVIAEGRRPESAFARDVMTSPVVSVTPETTVDACCQLMETNQIRRLPVVDRDGRCIGIVAQADVAREASERDTAEVVKAVSEPGSSHVH